jgi:hypothetical protein
VTETSLESLHLQVGVVHLKEDAWAIRLLVNAAVTLLDEEGFITPESPPPQIPMKPHHYHPRDQRPLTQKGQRLIKVVEPVPPSADQARASRQRSIQRPTEPAPRALTGH